ncbi:hypothetical protein B0H66DRAFT_526298 [Apodospora peruviana]|uniref:RING-type E3 ubiquitin transferase n=1 Tax=Apodospora peruviana TaxID=516989 RepID=A0AAE0IPE9_9PEZI|nr:hypothetical protein B0H66DRAFT_526298 [Apodospora peruviana]
MAGVDGGGLSAQAAEQLSNSDSASPSSSGSSYVGSGGTGPHSESACLWRTEQFHDQECLRYFDCPSHTVPRDLSNISEGEQGDLAASAVGPSHEQQNDDEHEDRGDVEMTDVESDEEEDHSERDTVSPLSEEDRQPPGAAHSSQDPPETDNRSVPQTPSDNSQVMASGGSTDVSRPGDVWGDPEAPVGSFHNPIILADDYRSSIERQPQQQQSDTIVVASNPTIPVPNQAALRRIPTFEGDRTPSETPSESVQRPAYGSQPPSDAPGATLYLPPAVPDRRGPPEYELPRWQPDAEVTYCPICYAQFSIFVRKHHCRITIPYQYIVQPPGTPRQSISSRYLTGGVDISIVGGGERVRLCNPCVPDPNTAPPQTISQGAHSRSQSTLPGPYPDQGESGQVSNPRMSYFSSRPALANDLHARSRSVTMAGPAHGAGNPYHQHHENRVLSGTPPALSYRGYSSSQPQPQQPQRGQHYSVPQRYRPLIDLTRDNNGGSSSRAGPSSSAAGPSNNDNRRLPPLPQQQQQQIPEEDECPVCHRELPPRILPNFESLREAHIQTCITSHSTYNGSVPAGANAGGAGSPPLPPVPPRLSGMFPYIATEKDCVDSAECTICLEEFEVGVPMARLECLCRFHRTCITAWWERHPGRCPVHQHGDFGF